MGEQIEYLVVRSQADILADLPKTAMARHHVNGATIMLRRGERGFWHMPQIKDPDEWNARHGVTKAQVEAMRCGSIFGFDVPGADPLNNLEGRNA